MIFDTHAIGVIIKGDKYWFRPKEDITTYELAQCVSLFISCSVRGCTKNILGEQWDLLQFSVTRHFEKVDSDSLDGSRESWVS